MLLLLYIDAMVRLETGRAYTLHVVIGGVLLCRNFFFQFRLRGAVNPNCVSESFSYLKLCSTGINLNKHFSLLFTTRI
jgi:hypothetical protein